MIVPHFFACSLNRRQRLKTPFVRTGDLWSTADEMCDEIHDFAI